MKFMIRRVRLCDPWFRSNQKRSRTPALCRVGRQRRKMMEGEEEEGREGGGEGAGMF